MRSVKLLSRSKGKPTTLYTCGQFGAPVYALISTGLPIAPNRRLIQALQSAETAAETDLPKKVFDTLGEALKRPNENVPIKLVLKGSGLTDDQLTVLLNGIRSCPFVRRINLRGTEISSAGFVDVLQFLKDQVTDALSPDVWDSMNHTCVKTVNLPPSAPLAANRVADDIANILPVCRVATATARIRLAFYATTRGSPALRFKEVEHTVVEAVGHHPKPNELRKITDSTAPGCDHTAHTMNLAAFERAHGAAAEGSPGPRRAGNRRGEGSRSRRRRRHR